VLVLAGVRNRTHVGCWIERISAPNRLSEFDDSCNDLVQDAAMNEQP
jgi:hypothetical protein